MIEAFFLLCVIMRNYSKCCGSSSATCLHSILLAPAFPFVVRKHKQQNITHEHKADSA